MTTFEWVRLGLEILGLVAVTVGGTRFVVVKKIADILIEAIEIHSENNLASGKILKETAKTLSNAEGIGAELHFLVKEITEPDIVKIKEKFND